MTPSKDCKIYDCLSGLCLLETEFIENENSLEAGFHVKNKIVPQPTPCPNKSCLEGNWRCLWYRWRKYFILIRIRLNFFLILLLLFLLFLVLLLAREKERLWTSVSKWGGLFLYGDLVFWNAIRKKPNIRQESHHLSLVISLISSKQRFVCGNFVSLRKTSTHCIVCYGQHTVSFL